MPGEAEMELKDIVGKVVDTVYIIGDEGVAGIELEFEDGSYVELYYMDVIENHKYREEDPVLKELPGERVVSVSVNGDTGEVRIEFTNNKVLVVDKCGYIVGNNSSD